MQVVDEFSQEQKQLITSKSSGENKSIEKKISERKYVDPIY